MKLTAKLKEKFCKDMNIPIRVFEEPIFMDRIVLLDSQYNTVALLKGFEACLESYAYEQDFFEDYNKVKESAIAFILGTDGYKRFNEQDMTVFNCVNTDYPSKDIFKETFVGREFISVDMKKANFTALRHYSSDIVGDAKTYEEFMSRFTSNLHLQKSKYIRQVIFGTCNPRRQVTYEKHLMDKVLTSILCLTKKSQIVYFATDEIVIDITDTDPAEKDHYVQDLHALASIFGEHGVTLSLEQFTLRKIEGTDGYMKVFVGGGFDLKCLDALMLPYVMRKLNGEPVNDYDNYFMHEGRLAKFVDEPSIVLQEL